MRTLLAAALLALALSPAFAEETKVSMYNSEDGAQVHCPLDKIVWLEPKAHKYYFRSSKHYANSGTGGFACMEEAKAAGNKRGDS